MKIYICICNYNAGNKLKNTLESIFKYKKDFVSIYIFDNNSKDLSKDIIKHYQLKINDYKLNSNNIGKAKAINYIINKIIQNENNIINDEDLIFSLDSDISLISEDFFDKIIKYWSILKNHISCIVCYQEGNSLFKRKIEFEQKDDLEYFVPYEGFGYGIAGGAIIVPYKYWKLVNGYRENCGLFGGDDGYLMYDLFHYTKKPICVIKNLTVFHPHDDNIEYRKWKDEALYEQIKYGKCLKENGFYD